MKIQNDKFIEQWMIREEQKYKKKEAEVYFYLKRRIDIQTKRPLEHKKVRELKMEKK